MKVATIRERLAKRFARNVLKDCQLPDGKQEFKADLETAFQSGWDAAFEFVRRAAERSGAGVW